MKTSSKSGKVVRKTAAEVKISSDKDLARMLRRSKGAIDTSDLPELSSSAKPLQRQKSGKLPIEPSVIREAILKEMKRRKFTVYAVWKEAKEFCPQISQSAVSEFLKGQRQLRINYADALFRALSLKVTRDVRRKKTVARQSVRSAV